MTELVFYSAARQALAKAHEVDEVLEIKNKAHAVEAYARQAKDGQLIEHAIDIKDRAERRLGELMAKLPKAPPGGGNQHLKKKELRVSGKPEAPPTLIDLGIDKNLANRAREKARLSEEEFERQLAMKKRKAKDTIEKIIEKPEPKATNPQRELEELCNKFASALKDIRSRGLYISEHLAKHAGLRFPTDFIENLDSACNTLNKLHSNVKRLP